MLDMTAVADTIAAAPAAAAAIPSAPTGAADAPAADAPVGAKAVACHHFALESSKQQARQLARGRAARGCERPEHVGQLTGFARCKVGCC